LSFVLCPLSFVLCPLSFVLCPLSFVLCSLFFYIFIFYKFLSIFYVFSFLPFFFIIIFVYCTLLGILYFAAGIERTYQEVWIYFKSIGIFVRNLILFLYSIQRQAVFMYLLHTGHQFPLLSPLFCLSSIPFFFLKHSPVTCLDGPYHHKCTNMILRGIPHLTSLTWSL
jgi:hypothetical protein